LSDAAHTIAAIFRIELPKLVARLARVVRDVGLAEEQAATAASPSAGVGSARATSRTRRQA